MLQLLFTNSKLPTTNRFVYGGWQQHHMAEKPTGVGRTGVADAVEHKVTLGAWEGKGLLCTQKGQKR